MSKSEYLTADQIYVLLEGSFDQALRTIAAARGITSGDIAPHSAMLLENCLKGLTGVACQWVEGNDPTIPHWGIEGFADEADPGSSAR